MPERRRLGRVEPETPLWWRRYNTLRGEGFVHGEAIKIAEGRINTPEMLKGRTARKRWYVSVKRLGLSDEELNERVDEMYDTHDWRQEYTQFYPEEGGEVFEEEVGVIG